ncbi:hypothetical protein [Luteolibacter luteus]|uniref:Uncharacterized protein n=1 Tax=Luteolibacter luteus TaxID=2728835 RepID=A0A858RRF1_9BACT|nr:hypothetical protein [Luteolibacter luteus]QJE98988.1 hypothetical protein HHL09_25480 [Luteolibacter luteus]
MPKRRSIVAAAGGILVAGILVLARTASPRSEGEAGAGSNSGIIPATQAYHDGKRSRASSAAQALAELRKLSNSTRYDGMRADPGITYEVRRLERLVDELGLDEVNALRNDSDLLAKASKESGGFSQAKTLLSLLDRRFGELAPGQVLDIAAYVGCASNFRYASMIEGASRSDSAAAIRFWREHLLDLKDREGALTLAMSGHFLNPLITGAVHADADAAWEMISAFNADEGPDGPSVLYFRGLPASTDWQEARSRLESLGSVPSEEPIARSAMELAGAWVKDDADAAMAWFGKEASSHPAAASSCAHVLDSWMRYDPDEALAWLQTWKPDEIDKGAIIQSMLRIGAESQEEQLLAALDDPRRVHEIVVSVCSQRFIPIEKIDRLIALDTLREETRQELRDIKAKRLAPAGSGQ